MEPDGVRSYVHRFAQGMGAYYFKKEYETELEKFFDAEEVKNDP